MPGTPQIGAISKAQKYSRNNYCEIFQLSHSAEKYPTKFSPRFENSFFSGLETSEKTNLPLEKTNFFFKKKYLIKKSHNAEKPKKRQFRLIKRFFYKPKTSKSSRGYPLIEFKNFQKNIA